MIKISVVVPVYKVETDYFEKCIESILNQTMRDIELIIADDGAGENIRDLTEAMSRNDCRIKVFHQLNRGVSAARNRALECCSGKYVTFIDADDYIAEDALDKLFKRAEKDELDVLLWGSYKFNETKKEKYMPYTDDIRIMTDIQKEQLQMKTMVGYLPCYVYPASHFGSGSTFAKLYKTDFIIKSGLRYPEGIKRAEDVNFNIRVFYAATRIGYINEHMYFYRIHSDSATFRYREDAVSILSDALYCLKDFVDEKHKSDLFIQVYYMRCIFFFLESMDTYFLHRQNPKNFRRRMSEMKQEMGMDPFCEAIKNISYKNLTAARKIPVFLMRHRQALLLSIFYKVYGIARKGRL